MPILYKTCKGCRGVSNCGELPLHYFASPALYGTIVVRVWTRTLFRFLRFPSLFGVCATRPTRANVACPSIPRPKDLLEDPGSLLTRLRP